MNIKKRLQYLEKIMDSFCEYKEFTGAVSQKNIKLAEQKLNILFPVSYCWFLMTYGAGFFGEKEIFGILETKEGELQEIEYIPNVIWVTEFFRKIIGLSEEYVAISGDGMGSYYFVKAEKEQRALDGQVLKIGLNINGTQSTKENCYSSLVSFFEDYILEEKL